MSHARTAAALAAALLVSAQPGFRSSLTATVNLPPEQATGETARLAEPARAPAGLRCRRVTLRWRERPGARRDAVYVSVRGDGPWTPLPAANVCGDVRPDGPTGVVDVEPAGGAPAVARRLYYKVFALADADAPPLDVTHPVPVELP
jgi:hypothetical protein